MSIQHTGRNSTGVMVTGNNNVNNLGVVRNLGRRGIPITLLISNHPTMVGYSRYISEKLACPSPEQSEEQFISFLVTLGTQIDEKCIIIPTSDREVLALSKYKDELEQYYYLPIPSFEVVHKLVNKREFYQLLAQMSIPHPRTYFPEDISELKSIGREIKYPYIIKPAYMHLFTAKFGTKCFVIRSPQDLNNAIRKLENAGLDIIIQDIIPGKEHYSLLTYLNKRSEPIAICGWDKLRQYPPDFGQSSLCKSAWRSGPIDLAIQTLKAIKYHGIAEPEFKKDPRDGQYKFLEINARTSIPNALPAKCGVDIVYTAYSDIMGEYKGKSVSPQSGILWIHEFDDLLSCLKQIREGTLSVNEVIKSRRGKKVYATAAWDDSIPFFMTLFNLALAVLKRTYNLKSKL